MHFLPKSFAFPAELADCLVKYFWDSSPTDLRSSEKFARDAQALARLWQKLAKERGQQARQDHYSFSPAEARAYAAYYLPANLLKVPLILAEAASLGLVLIEENALWMDWGCGPGTVALGLAWYGSRLPSFRYCGMDQSPHFLRLGAELVEQFCEQAREVKVDYSWKKWELHKNLPEQLRWLKQESPNILSFSNSLAEIFPDPKIRDESCRTLIAELRALAAADGKERWLLFIEPGAREPARELLELRESLRALKGFEILLPCLDNRACGALAQDKDWCHEEAACNFPDWLNLLGAPAGMRKESLLFSYLLCRVGGAPAEYQKSWPSGGARMVSQRLEHKGVTECWFCTSEGKKRSRITHSLQKKRENPLPLPNRGDLYSRLELDAKGEILSLEKCTGLARWIE